MPYPTPIVEVAFNDGPYVVSPTWTDVTAYVRNLETSRGVSNDWTLQADGSATVVLSNRDRRFDPFNTSGPYYGKLLPRRQIRIRATSGGTTYDVFRGFIAGWPPEWTDAGYDSTVTLSCFDALQLLGSSSMPADWAQPYILSLSPRHYYPCDEPIITGTTTTLRDLGSFSQPLTSTNAVSDIQLAFGLSSKSVQMLSGLTALVPDSTTRNFTCSMWANFETGNIFYLGRYYLDMYFDDSDNRYTATVYDHQLATFRRYKTTAQFDGGSPFMLTVTYNAPSSTLLMYLDGTLISTSLTTGTVSPPIGNLEGLFLGTGQFQQILVFHYELTADQIRNIYNYSDAIFPETTTARFNRIITETPFSLSLTNPPASPTASVLDITDDCPTAAGELALVSNSEYAPLFVNKAGVLTMFAQKQIWSQTTSVVSQVTYGGAGIPIGPEVQLQYDGDSMRNVANVQMSGGGVYIEANQSSIDVYGEAEQYVTTQVSTLFDADEVAEIVRNWGGYVYPKASPVSVVLSPNGTWGSTLALELWDRFTLVVTPRSGNTITTPMLLSRVSHSVTPERWTTTIEGSARWAAVFILNQSTLGGTDLLG